MKEIYRIIQGKQEMKKNLGNLFPLIEDALDDLRKDAAIDEFKSNNEPLDYKIKNIPISNKLFLYKPDLNRNIVYTCISTHHDIITSKELDCYYIGNENWENEIFTILSNKKIDCIRVELNESKYKIDYAIEIHKDEYSEYLKSNNIGLINLLKERSNYNL